MKASIAEIRIRLILMEDGPGTTWTQLVIAQDEFEYAPKADEGFSEAARQLRHLNSVEALLVPPQTFFSTCRSWTLLPASTVEQFRWE
jgi:hypothetical protein